MHLHHRAPRRYASLSWSQTPPSHPGPQLTIHQGGGTAIGGCFFPSTSTEPDMDLAERIMKRAIAIRPELVPPGCGIEALRVIRHQVGLRPVREGGPRVEIEMMHDPELG